MSAPFSPWPDDDPRAGFPTTTGRVGREVVGLLLIVLGVVALGVLLATVDWRWAAGLAAAVTIAAGVWLGTDSEGD